MLDLLIAILLFLLVAGIILGLLAYGLRYLPLDPLFRNLILFVAVLIALLLFLQRFGFLLV